MSSAAVRKAQQWVRDRLLRWGIEVRRVGVREQAGEGFSSLGEDEVIARRLDQGAHPEFCVDIGAGDGVLGSNIRTPVGRGWGGVAVEWGPERFAGLAHSYLQFPEMQLLRTRVTPENVVPLLEAFGTPRDFGLLSLDIDSYDHDVLDAILTRFRPSLVCAEINEKIPPPVKFSVDYRVEDFRCGGHFYGMSISILADLADRHDYSLVELEYNNAFLEPLERASVPAASVEDIYRRGYLDRPDRRERMPWNSDMEAVQGLSPEAALVWVEERFSAHEGRFTCTL